MVLKMFVKMWYKNLLPVKTGHTSQVNKEWSSYSVRYLNLKYLLAITKLQVHKTLRKSTNLQIYNRTSMSGLNDKNTNILKTRPTFAFRKTLLPYIIENSAFVQRQNLQQSTNAKAEASVKQLNKPLQLRTEHKFCVEETLSVTARCEIQRDRVRRIICHALGKNPNSYKNLHSLQSNRDNAILKPAVKELPVRGFNLENISSAVIFDILEKFAAPKNTLHNYYSILGRMLNTDNLLDQPKYVENDNFWWCTYKIRWPEELTFTEKGLAKKDSSHKSALTVLVWLRVKGFIDSCGRPLCRDILQNKLLSTKKPELQIRHYSTSNAGLPKQNNLVTVNENQPQNIHENANTQQNEIENYVTDIEEKEIEHVKKLYAAPKNVLHNCFDVLCKDLKNNDLKLIPQYKMVKQFKKSAWMCTYNLKWPEDMKISCTAATKQEASSKASLSALHWLKKNKKIDKDGSPIVYDNKEIKKISKISANTIILSKFVEANLLKINQIYNDFMLPLLVTNADKKLEANEIEISRKKCSEVEGGLMLPQKVPPRYGGLDLYLAREPIKLPISSYREDIIQLLEENRIVIIKGEPGCGKSTRVPQYVLEAWARRDDNGEPCRIVVTQPRRIAAISLAERVANEREENVGNIVGYRIRLQSNFNDHVGRIMYCTTGILLRQLQSDPSLSGCSHILLDEAHERDVNTDLLMNLLRQSLKLNPKLKLIVMSATIDTDKMQNYFDNAPVLHIPGFTYPVKTHFLDESKALDLTKTRQMCASKIPDVVHEDVVKLIMHLHAKKGEGAILCFLPGWEDIKRVKNLLPESNDKFVLCLHSRLQDSEQKKIFSRSPPGVRKIILATNIAETSVTVDDVVYVIDTGIHKEERFDIDKGVRCIDNHWISQASMTQRKGRAGRVQAGESYHLYSRTKFDEFLEYSIPEILRTSLTKIVLDTKVYSNNMNAVEFLSHLPCPPDENAVLKAVDELRELEMLDDFENLTPLGRTVADFQLPPKLSKAMVNSVIFKCVTPVVDIATIFSADTELFATSLMDKESVKKTKIGFSKNSDHLAYMRLFEKWLEYYENNDYQMVRIFCEQEGLVPHKFKLIQKLREIHFEYLYKSLYDVFPMSDKFSDNNELVKAVLLSGVGTVLQHRTWDVVKGRLKKSNTFITRNNQKATITSESVNFKRSYFPSDYLLYINETLSNIRRTTLVRETSLISPLAVLLFKNNNLIIEKISKENFSDKLNSEDQVLLNLDGTKLSFLCDKQQAVAIKNCKDALKEGMQYYVFQLTKGSEYDSTVNKHWNEILQTVNDILFKETISS